MHPDHDRRVYLAGPDVFHPDHRAVLDAKKAVCAEVGLVGVSPLDSEVDHSGEPSVVSRRIYDGNRAFMESCRWCIANAAPFRGVSMDVGTAFEIGYMVAAGKVVYAYTDHPSELGERHRAMLAANAALRETTGDGWRIEMFGHFENLMIPFGVLQSGGEFLAPEAGRIDPFRDLTLFRRCAAKIAARAAA
jgi:nucleoside 2-deoxyribosyltransferase